MHDQLAIANWQRSKNARRRQRPKPISPLAKRGKRIGKTDRTPEEVKAFLARFGPAPDAPPSPIQYRHQVEDEWLEQELSRG